MSSQKFKALRTFALLIPALFLTGCSKVSELGFPEGVTSVNDESLSLWQGAWIAAGVVGVITLILIVWPAIFHRPKKDGPEFPKQTQYHIPIEIIYTIIPFIIVAVMFYYTAKKETVITAKSDSVMHQISVTGMQWSWQFAYPDAGPSAIVTGTPSQKPTLVIPLGERVRYTIISNDVVHGFWIPAFMIQMQNIPGVTNHLEFTANKLGEYPGRCNILCGRAHSQMIFTVKVVTPTDYQAYLETLKGSQA
ncbi:MAG: cytochrome c oxidase subunit II [Candidatus Planktophila sp.]|nr:cytochrome c oxidase subunit II [Candidatus Planktophila sp.]